MVRARTQVTRVRPMGSSTRNPLPAVTLACFRRAVLVALGLLFALPPASHAAPAGYDAVKLFGHDYVDARDFGRRYGLDASWIVRGKSLRLQSKWTKIEFTEHAVEMSLNGLTLFLSEPIVAHAGSLYLSRGDIDKLLAPILVPHAAPTKPALKTIVIDPGHGGNDPGNQNRRLKLNEKVYTLDVAKRLQRLLTAQGYRVVLTRKSDTRVELEDRTALARRVKGDLFVSIHFNGFSDPKVAGAETYIMTPSRQRSTPQRESNHRMLTERYAANRHDHWNAVLGYHVHRQLTTRLNAPDRGLKRFRYHVLRSAHCPAVLVEAAFLSNDVEGRKVASVAYRQRIAEGVAAGIKAYAAALNRARQG